MSDSADPRLVPYPFTAEHYAAVLPPLRDGVDTTRRKVVIAGGGPVGLTAALGLASHGIPVVLLEADDSVCFGSRAICISRRSLEIASRLNALDGFLRIGLPWTGGRSFYRGDEVLHFSMPQDENQRLPPMINLAQYHIEQILLDRALQMKDLIEIRWQSRLAGIGQQRGGMRLAVSTPAGDYKLDADWLIAADGGRSFVRDALGLQLQGTSYEGRYVIVDIRLDSPRPTERLAYFDPPCNPGSTVLVHKQPDNVWRIDYQLQDGEDPDAAILLDNVLPRVESLLEMMGERGSWAPIWTGIYKANALTLPSYRHGRVFFAGDSAHLVPIFGVRGANSGIDDADNIAWKLALVIKGLASDALLDSYSSERVAATHENLSYGIRSTEFMAPPTFAFDLMRTAVLGLAVKHPHLQPLINPRQSSAITYSASPLNAAPERSAEFDTGPVPGSVLFECPVMIAEDGLQEPKEGFLTELLGQWFTMMYFGDSSAVPGDLRDVEASAAARGVPVRLVTIAAGATAAEYPAPMPTGYGADAIDHTGRLFPLYGATPGTLYLVRPDGHVLARWRKAVASEVGAALDGALHPETSHATHPAKAEATA